MSQRRVTRLLLLAAGAAMLALPAVLYLRPARFLATHWRDEMQSLPESELPLRMQQLVGLGEEGWTVVVEALDDSRRTVSEEARRILHEQLDRWQTLNLRESSPRVAGLARVLAESSSESGAAARQMHAGLATRILLWPIDRRQVDGAQLVADCEQVLRIARSERPSVVGSAPAASGNVATTSVRDYGTGVSRIESEMLALPGGNLPIDIANAASLPRLSGEQASTPSPGEPSLFRPSSPWLLRAVPAAGRPTATPAVSDQTEDSVTRSRAQTRQDPDPSQQHTRGQLVSVPPAAQPLGALADLELMQSLQDADQARVTAASYELSRRGFDKVHIEIARKLFHPDAHVRAQLIDALPQVAGIDARPWLMVLSRDEDPALRRRVIGMFATSNDPTLHKHLREIEQAEPDPEIRALVRRSLDLERR